MRKIKKTSLNYFFLFLISSYFFLLISRLILDRLPKTVLGFILFYFCFALLMMLIPITLKVFLKIWLKLKKAQSSELNPNSFSKFFSRIKTFFLEKFLFFKQAFVKDFFLNFLGKKRNVRIFFFSLIKFFEKFINYKVFFICLILLIPWIVFLFTFFYEILYKDYFLISLYILSFNFLLKFIFKIMLLISIQYVLGLAYVDLLIYLPKIIKNEDLKTFFLNNHEMKLKFFENSIKSKAMFCFYWKLFSKINYFYCFRLKLDTLKHLFDKTQKLIKNLNVVIFGYTLLLYLNKESLFFPFTVMLIFSLLTFLIICWLFLNFSFREEDLDSGYNRKYLIVINDWFLTIKPIILENNFLTEEDLPYPYINLKSANLMVSEDLELQSIILENEKNLTFQGFAEFSIFSDYLLTEEETLELQKTEDFVVSWYFDLLNHNLIDFETCKILKSSAVHQVISSN